MYGGVAGSIVGDDNSMSNCCNSGEIKETGYSVGGLCGFFQGIWLVVIIMEIFQVNIQWEEYQDIWEETVKIVITMAI